MINLDRAASIAKDFLTRTCGLDIYELQEIGLENDKWIVIYKPHYGAGLYTVELGKESGEILSFKRGS
jgi:hypothetical protein